MRANPCACGGIATAGGRARGTGHDASPKDYRGLAIAERSLFLVGIGRALPAKANAPLSARKPTSVPVANKRIHAHETPMKPANRDGTEENAVPHKALILLDEALLRIVYTESQHQ